MATTFDATDRRLAVAELVKHEGKGVDLHAAHEPDDPGSYRAVFKTKPDDIGIDFYDEDFYGRVREVDSWGGEPEDFDPERTQRINAYHGPYWWEAPLAPDEWTSTPDRVKFRRMVEHIVSFGFQVLVVEVTHTIEGGYSRTEDAALGGVEPMVDDAYLSELVHDLLHEALTRFDDVELTEDVREVVG